MPIQELSDSNYAEKVMRARSTPIEEKLLDGPRLFVFACEGVRAGIRAQVPDASGEEIERLLRRRLELIGQLEEYRG